MGAALLAGLESGLRAVASILGIPGTIILVTLVLGAFLFLVYMILRFGEHGVEILIPFVREIFRTLRSEATKSHPAIKIELLLHCLFGMIAVVCLLASVLHALSPFVREDMERLILYSFITSFVVCIALGGVSITLAVRLK